MSQTLYEKPFVKTPSGLVEPFTIPVDCSVTLRAYDRSVIPIRNTFDFMTLVQDSIRDNLAPPDMYR